MLKIKELLDPEGTRGSFCFDVQAAAGGKELFFFTREGLSQRIWGSRLSVRVINIIIVFFERELEKGRVFLRNSMDLNHCFKK